MIDLPDFSKSVDFQRLREKMGASLIPSLPSIKFEKKVIIKKEIIEPNKIALAVQEKVKSGSLVVNIEDIASDEQGFLNIHGVKVVAYIRDQPRGIDRYYKTTTYRYHLCECKTIKQMRDAGRENRYIATKNISETFKVYDTSHYRPKQLNLKMDLCYNCVQELKYRRLWFTPFSLKEFFGRYDSDVPKTIKREELVEEIQTYSPNQQDLAREYKKALNFKCQSCDVDCSSDHSLLHLHHRDGVPSNNNHENLAILCVDCHSRQPMHEQVLHPEHRKLEVEKIRTLRKKQGIIDFGIAI